MTIFLVITIGIASTFISYQLGKIKGVDEYHDHLMREGKIHEK